MMGEYIVENVDGEYNVSFVDEDIKDLVAITYHEIHAKIIAKAFNDFHGRVLDSSPEEDSNI